MSISAEDQEALAICNKVAVEAADLIIKRLTEADAKALTVPVTLEQIAVVLLIKSGNDPGIIDQFCQRVKQTTDEYRRKKAQ